MSVTGDPAVAVDVPSTPSSRSWAADATLPRATLRIAPAARWIVERYPIDEVSEPSADGTITVSLPVMSERWLERVLLRAGADVTVVSPHEWQDLAARAARRVLDLYR